jgi:hypothetical protein
MDEPGPSLITPPCAKPGMRITPTLNCTRLNRQNGQQNEARKGTSLLAISQVLGFMGRDNVILARNRQKNLRWPRAEPGSLRVELEARGQESTEGG